MSFSALVEPCNGEFRAQLLGAPQVSVVASTRERAIDALRVEVTNRMQAGELVPLEAGYIGITDIAGKYADDPTLTEICEEAYRLRNAERVE
jgi:hypothetical protein